MPAVLRLLLAACQPLSTALGARDCAMLLRGFGAALRRSELVVLQLGDVEPAPGQGLRLLVCRSKIDPHGHGQESAIWANPAEPLLCPLAALSAWRGDRDRARDLDGSAAESRRKERPLSCAVAKAGRPTGAALSDKVVAWPARAPPRGPGWTRSAVSATRCALAWRQPPAPPAPPCPASCGRPGTKHPGGARLSPPHRPLAQQRHRTGVRNEEARRRLRRPVAG